MEKSDEELLDLFHHEPTREIGFRCLMNQYQQALYSQIHYLLKNHTDTDDVLQNTWLKVWNGLHSFKGEAKLYTWLYRVAHNESLNFLKKKQKHATSEMPDASIVSSATQHHELDMSAAEIEKKFEMALLQLPEKQKEVFCMRYYEEMPYEEMSRLTGTSIGALKANFHHAAKKIESFLKQH